MGTLSASRQAVIAYMADLYREGQTLRQIAKTMGLSVGAVLRRLDAAGVERRRSGRQPVPAARKAAVLNALRTETWRDTARRHKVSLGTIGRWRSEARQ